MDRTPPVPLPAASGADLASLAPEYTHQYRQMLSNRRMKVLEEAERLRRLSPADAQQPTARPSIPQVIRNIPMMPKPPQDQRSVRMRAWMQSLSRLPRAWISDPDALDRVLEQIPLQSLQARAAEKYDVLCASAASLGRVPDWEEADCLMQVLLRWFRASFMTWVNNPPCERCNSVSVALGNTPPTEEEERWGATTVELYRCSNEICKSYVRFPRYSSPVKLMEVRRGRGGEWVNCFGFICRAVSLRVRWVWCAEDLVWLEYYSFYQKRWIHVDVCEGVIDKPLMYTEVWKRQFSYCIAFSEDQAVDVTRRYVRRPWKTGKARRKCPEPVLQYILHEIRHQWRAELARYNKNYVTTLLQEDRREEQELREYILKAVTEDVCSLRVDDILRGSTAQSGAQRTQQSSDIKVPSRADSAEANRIAEANHDTGDTSSERPHQSPR